MSRLQSQSQLGVPSSPAVSPVECAPAQLWAHPILAQGAAEAPAPHQKSLCIPGQRRNFDHCLWVSQRSTWLLKAKVTSALSLEDPGRGDVLLQQVRSQEQRGKSPGRSQCQPGLPVQCPTLGNLPGILLRGSIEALTSHTDCLCSVSSRSRGAQHPPAAPLNPLQPP